MKKLIAIASSDWHLNDWSQFNHNERRVKVSDKFITDMLIISHTEMVPILFPGDMFHTPAALTNYLIEHYNTFFSEASKKYPNARIIGITGNHDESEVNSKGTEFKSHFNSYALAFPNLITCIDHKSIYLKEQGISVCGIPYIKHNKGFIEALESFKNVKDPKILLIHTNLYGAKDPSGYEIDEVPNIPRNLGKTFKDFKLVLAGHIHKHEKLWKEKVIMVGAPYQQRVSDSGTKMGYLEIYDDFSTEFVSYDAPEFKYYNEGEPLPNDYDFFIEIPNPVKSKEKEIKTFNNITDKTLLAKKYFKVKGIKNKRRLNILIELLNKSGD